MSEEREPRRQEESERQTEAQREEVRIGRAAVRWLNTREAAEFLGVKLRTLSTYRWRGHGPIYTKAGNLIVYKLEDLQAYQKKAAQRIVPRKTVTRHGR